MNWIFDPADSSYRNEDDAIDQAFDNLETTPAAVADWLAKACDVTQTDWLPHNPFRLGRMARQGSIELTPAQALAVLFGGTEKDALHALYILREAHREAVKDDAYMLGKQAWEKQCADDKHINHRGFYY